MPIQGVISMPIQSPSWFQLDSSQLASHVQSVGVSQFNQEIATLVGGAPESVAEQEQLVKHLIIYLREFYDSLTQEQKSTIMLSILNSSDIRKIFLESGLKTGVTQEIPVVIRCVFDFLVPGDDGKNVTSSSEDDALSKRSQDPAVKPRDDGEEGRAVTEKQVNTSEEAQEVDFEKTLILENDIGAIPFDAEQTSVLENFIESILYESNLYNIIFLKETYEKAGRFIHFNQLDPIEPTIERSKMPAVSPLNADSQEDYKVACATSFMLLAYWKAAFVYFEPEFDFSKADEEYRLLQTFNLRGLGNNLTEWLRYLKDHMVFIQINEKNDIRNVFSLFVLKVISQTLMEAVVAFQSHSTEKEINTQDLLHSEAGENIFQVEKGLYLQREASSYVLLPYTTSANLERAWTEAFTVVRNSLTQFIPRLTQYLSIATLIGSYSDVLLNSSVCFGVAEALQHTVVARDKLTIDPLFCFNPLIGSCYNCFSVNPLFLTAFVDAVSKNSGNVCKYVKLLFVSVWGTSLEFDPVLEHALSKENVHQKMSDNITKFILFYYKSDSKKSIFRISLPGADLAWGVFREILKYQPELWYNIVKSQPVGMHLFFKNMIKNVMADHLFNRGDLITEELNALVLGNIGQILASCNDNDKKYYAKWLICCFIDHLRSDYCRNIHHHYNRNRSERVILCEHPFARHLDNYPVPTKDFFSNLIDLLVKHQPEVFFQTVGYHALVYNESESSDEEPVFFMHDFISMTLLENITFRKHLMSLPTDHLSHVLFKLADSSLSSNFNLKCFSSDSSSYNDFFPNRPSVLQAFILKICTNESDLIRKCINAWPDIFVEIEKKHGLSNQYRLNPFKSLNGLIFVGILDKKTISQETFQPNEQLYILKIYSLEVMENKNFPVVWKGLNIIDFFNDLPSKEVEKQITHFISLARQYDFEKNLHDFNQLLINSFNTHKREDLTEITRKLNIRVQLNLYLDEFKTQQNAIQFLALRSDVKKFFNSLAGDELGMFVLSFFIMCRSLSVMPALADFLANIENQELPLALARCFRDYKLNHNDLIKNYLVFKRCMEITFLLSFMIQEDFPIEAFNHLLTGQGNQQFLCDSADFGDHMNDLPPELKEECIELYRLRKVLNYIQVGAKLLKEDRSNKDSKVAYSDDFKKARNELSGELLTKVSLFRKAGKFSLSDRKEFENQIAEILDKHPILNTHMETADIIKTIVASITIIGGIALGIYAIHAKRTQGVWLPYFHKKLESVEDIEKQLSDLQKLCVKR